MTPEAFQLRECRGLQVAPRRVPLAHAPMVALRPARLFKVARHTSRRPLTPPARCSFPLLCLRGAVSAKLVAGA